MEQPIHARCGADEGASDSCDSTPTFREKATGASRQGIRLLIQLALVVGIYGAGCALSSVSPVALPGNILGMILLLALLGTGLIKTKHVDMACDCLIDNMSLFFIPAGVAIMGCFSLLEENAFKFAFICIVTTILVFLATSYTVMFVSRLLAHRNTHAVAPDEKKA